MTPYSFHDFWPKTMVPSPTLRPRTSIGISSTCSWSSQTLGTEKYGTPTGWTESFSESHHGNWEVKYDKITECLFGPVSMMLKLLEGSPKLPNVFPFSLATYSHAFPNFGGKSPIFGRTHSVSPSPPKRNNSIAVGIGKNPQVSASFTNCVPIEPQNGLRLNHIKHYYIL